MTDNSEIIDVPAMLMREAKASAWHLLNNASQRHERAEAMIRDILR